MGLVEQFLVDKDFCLCYYVVAMKAATKTNKMSGMDNTSMSVVLSNCSRDDLRKLCASTGVVQGRTKTDTVNNLVSAMANADIELNFQIGV